jgi:hypothetical protein
MRCNRGGLSSDQFTFARAVPILRRSDCTRDELVTVTALQIDDPEEAQASFRGEGPISTATHRNSQVQAEHRRYASGTGANAKRQRL